MIAAAIERIARDTPKAVAVRYRGRETSYGELHEMGLRLAAGLASLAGRRVGVVVQSFPRQLACLLALDRLGASAFLYLASGESVAEAAARSELHLAGVLSDLPNWNELLSRAEDGAGEVPACGEGSVVLFTSGTSGPPKPIVHTWRSLSAAVQMDERNLGRRWLLSYNQAGFAALQVMLQSLLTGGRLSVAETREPAAVSRILMEEQVEFATGTPTFWRMLLQGALPEDLARCTLRQITLGGEVVTQDVLDRLRAAFPMARVSHIYASTEMGSCFAVHDGKAGFPASWITSGAAACELRVDESGELLVRSQRAMLGYLETEWSREGWFPTGDLVARLGDRYLFVGRKSDCINVGGAKVYPLEVESVIRTVSGVKDVVVKGRASSVVGQLVSAEVVLEEGVDPVVARREILSECRLKLARYKAPAIVEFKRKVTVTESNKISRRAE